MFEVLVDLCQCHNISDRQTEGKLCIKKWALAPFMKLSFSYLQIVLAVWEFIASNEED